MPRWMPFSLHAASNRGSLARLLAATLAVAVSRVNHVLKTLSTRLDAGAHEGKMTAAIHAARAAAVMFWQDGKKTTAGQLACGVRPGAG